MFGMMRIYTVHIDPAEPSASQKPTFIREGFNWIAFLLGGLWALYHRLWLPLVLILAFNGALMTLRKEHLISMAGIATMQFGFNIFVGLQANDWLRAKLARRGFLMADVTAADSKLRAEQRYFERYLAA